MATKRYAAPVTHDSILDSDTLAPGPAPSRSSSAGGVRTLTVLGHPLASRVGDTFRLPTSGVVAISRKEPEFQGSSSGPLLTPFLSRKPVQLVLRRNGVEVDVRQTSTPVSIDGTPVNPASGVALVDDDAIQRGTVLELGSHVTLLLHLRGQHMTRDGDFGLIGDSDGIDVVRQQIAQLSMRETAVLIRGETGTGKELVAAALHQNSRRRNGPYVVANMAAIPSSLAASELFGHARGAFSGARDAHDGFFVRADGGTLFLDEVGDTPDDVQAALLRVLETGEVQGVGAKRVQKTDTRVVSATDADVEGAIANGRFRAPVYYRLAQSEIRIPPLRERRDDIARLLIFFLLGELAKEGREHLLMPELTERDVWLPAPLVARLAAYDWPGNIRQLKSVATQLAARSRLDPADPFIAQLLPPTSRAQSASTPAGPVGRAPRITRRPSDIAPDEVERVLEACDYKLGQAAEQLGISRPAFNDLVDSHPSLQRAERMSAIAIAEGIERAAQLGVEPHRLLKVSKRGLARRRKALGI